MGEKKQQPVAAAEGKKVEEEKKAEDTNKQSPKEIVLEVYMHCEGCARKLRKSLQGFEGVENVTTDCKSSKMVVKGEKADPLKVLERVQRKSHRQVHLISSIPKPPSAEEEKKAEVKEEEEQPKPEDEKEEVPQVITVVLRINMHCEACALEIKKRIQRMKGVESAEPDLKSSEVTVKGAFKPQQLVNYVYKRTGKQAEIVNQEQEDQNKDAAAKEEQQPEKQEKANAESDEQEHKEEMEETKLKDDEVMETVEETKLELKRNEYSYQYHYQQQPKYAMEMYAYPPPPQIFSDENPNACSVM